MCKYCDKVFINDIKDKFDDPDKSIAISKNKIKFPRNSMELYTDLCIVYYNVDNKGYEPYLNCITLLNGIEISSFITPIKNCPKC